MACTAVRPAGATAPARRHHARHAREPAADDDAWPAGARGHGAHERRLCRARRRRRRQRQPRGDAVEAGVGGVRGAKPRPARSRRLQQAAGAAPAGAVPLARAWRDRGVAAPGARPVVLLCAKRFAGRWAPRAAVGCRAAGLCVGPPCAGRLQRQRARPLRPGLDRAGPQAGGGRQGIVVCGGRRRNAPPGRAGRTVLAGGRLAAPAVPDGRNVCRRVAAGRAADPATRARAAGSLGDGGRDQPVVRRGGARIGRLRPHRVAAAGAAPGRAVVPRAAGPAARAARSVDGGAVPARLRPPDHGQRGTGIARHLVRGRDADRPVFP